MKNSYNLCFVIGFALIPLLKRQINTEENGYLQVISSYVERKFKMDNTLPIPYLTDYVIFTILTYFGYRECTIFIILQGIRIVFHIFLVYFIYKIFFNSENGNFMDRNMFIHNLFPIIFCKSMLQHSVRLSCNSSLFYSAFSIYLFLQDKCLLSSIFIGLAISTNWAALGGLSTLFIVIICEFYNDITNISKAILITCVNTLRKMMIIISIPILVYFISFILSYLIRYQYDPSLNNFSLEFQSTFNNTDIEKCNRTLVNNSIITLINRRYKWYLSADKKENNFRVFGSNNLNENCLWIVKKESGKEGLIFPGEKVRIIHFSYEKALSLNKVDSKDKFFPLELTDEEAVIESENELFKFEILIRPGKAGIEARSTVFKLVNTNTKMDLCMRKISKKNLDAGSAEMSFYANKKNLEFYIADNQSPKNEDDEMLNYPKLSFFLKFIEHQESLFKNRHLNRTGLKNWTVVNYIDVSIIYLIPLFLLMNYVFFHRYDKGFNISHDFLFLYILHLFTESFSYLLMEDKLLKNVINSTMISSFLRIINDKVAFGYNAVIFLSFFS